mmetsp:Transcript_17634/g.52703  ORF Transcript_17634/g.52703 Transcript_17634/m.52703 type:complete len:213 (-) Transcript_17634:265-903(-)
MRGRRRQGALRRFPQILRFLVQASRPSVAGTAATPVDATAITTATIAAATVATAAIATSSIAATVATARLVCHVALLKVRLKLSEAIAILIQQRELRLILDATTARQPADTVVARVFLDLLVGVVVVLLVVLVVLDVEHTLDPLESALRAHRVEHLRERSAHRHAVAPTVRLDPSDPQRCGRAVTIAVAVAVHARFGPEPRLGATRAVQPVQ